MTKVLAYAHRLRILWPMAEIPSTPPALAPHPGQNVIKSLNAAAGYLEDFVTQCPCETHPAIVGHAHHARAHIREMLRAFAGCEDIQKPLQLAKVTGFLLGPGEEESYSVEGRLVS